MQSAARVYKGRSRLLTAVMCVYLLKIYCFEVTMSLSAWQWLVTSSDMASWAQSTPGSPPGEIWTVSETREARGAPTDNTGWETSEKMTRRQILGFLFILIFADEPWTVDPLTMGFGKNLYLAENHDGFAGRAFDFNIFPSSGDHFQDPFVHPARKRFHPHHPHDHFSLHHDGPQHFLEIDLKYAKKKPIPGVRHLFCSGYYCAFEYASW